MKVNNLPKLLLASAVGLGTAGQANEVRANPQGPLPQVVKETKLQKSPTDKLENYLYAKGIPGPHVPFIVLSIGAILTSLGLTKRGAKVLNYPIIKAEEGKKEI